MIEKSIDELETMLLTESRHHTYEIINDLDTKDVERMLQVIHHAALTLTGSLPSQFYSSTRPTLRYNAPVVASLSVPLPCARRVILRFLSVS
jgi:hypothetical protein